MSHLSVLVSLSLPRKMLEGVHPQLAGPLGRGRIEEICLLETSAKAMIIWIVYSISIRNGMELGNPNLD